MAGLGHQKLHRRKENSSSVDAHESGLRGGLFDGKFTIDDRGELCELLLST